MDKKKRFELVNNPTSSSSKLLMKELAKDHYNFISSRLDKDRMLEKIDIENISSEHMVVFTDILKQEPDCVFDINETWQDAFHIKIEMTDEYDHEGWENIESAEFNENVSVTAFSSNKDENLESQATNKNPSQSQSQSMQRISNVNNSRIPEQSNSLVFTSPRKSQEQKKRKIIDGAEMTFESFDNTEMGDNGTFIGLTETELKNQLESKEEIFNEQQKIFDRLRDIEKEKRELLNKLEFLSKKMKKC